MLESFGNRLRKVPLRTGLLIRLLVVLGAVMSAVFCANAQNRDIGGYVDNAEDRFVRNVWNFIKEFKTRRDVGSFHWKYDQYYYPEPYVFQGSAAAYVDAEDFAYYSGHGNNYTISCHDANGDTDLRAAPGYGDLSKNGDLEFIVFESCAVVPSPDDRADWSSGWLRNSTGKHIFQGLHQALGFRTLSVSDNGIPNNYANRLKGAQGVWQGWFAAIDDERWWSWLHGDVESGVPYPGYASVVLYPGLDNDSLAAYGADPPSNQSSLRIYWEY